MKYSYSAENRLDDPHSYMYSEFAGRDLLEAYRKSRLSVLRDLSDSGVSAPPEDALRDAGLVRAAHVAFRNQLEKIGAGERFESLLAARPGELDEATTDPGENEQAWEDSAADPVHTSRLLRNLVAQLTAGRVDTAAKRQLDGLLHRFEISKKLYARYDSDFRNGEGDARDARLYWLLSLALLLHFLRSGQMKYASTMLKATDLLCSLPQDHLRRDIAVRGLALLLAAELACMEQLIQNQGAYAD